MAHEITERIKQLMEEYDFSSSGFADEIGVQRPAISHVLSGRNRPSLDVVMKILKAFDEINPQWLLTGEGKMKQLNLFGEEEGSKKSQITDNKQDTELSASESHKTKQPEPSSATEHSQSLFEANTKQAEIPSPNKYVQTQPEVPDEAPSQSPSNHHSPVHQAPQEKNSPHPHPHAYPPPPAGYYNYPPPPNYYYGYNPPYGFQGEQFNRHYQGQQGDYRAQNDYKSGEESKGEPFETNAPNKEHKQGEKEINEGKSLPDEAIAAAFSEDNEKEIERIVIFYSDKSFKIYNPE